jgi:hypothetical protein
LRETQAVRGPAEMELLGEGDDVPELAKLH